MAVERIKAVPEAACAYAAGLIDGEAWIGVTRNPQRRHSYSVCVRINMTEPAPVRFMHRTFGGRFVGARQREPKRRPVYEWDFSGIALATLLARVLPYLQGKRTLAKVAMAFTRRLRMGKLVTAEEALIRENLFHTMRGLVKQRGKNRARLRK